MRTFLKRLALLLWAILPLAFFVGQLAFERPDSKLVIPGIWWLFIWSSLLLYAALGVWLHWKSPLASNDSFSVLTLIFGLVFCLPVGFTADLALTLFNASASREAHPRSVLGFIKTDRHGIGRHAFTSSVLSFQHRLDPLAEQAIELSRTEGERMAHVCMTEHVGRLSGIWFEQIRDCDAPPEHFTTLRLDSSPATRLEFLHALIDAGFLDERGRPAPAAPMSVSTRYTAVADPQTGDVKPQKVRPPPGSPWQAVDLEGMSKTLPLPFFAKSGVEAIALSSDRRWVLARCAPDWLFLYDGQHKRWYFLQGVPKRAGSRDVAWVFSADGRALYAHDERTGQFSRRDLSGLPPS